VLREQKVESKEKSSDEVTIDATGIPAAAVNEDTGSSGNAISPNGSAGTKTIMVRKSKGMMAGGIVLASLGAPTALVGVAVAGGTPATGAGIFVFLLGTGMTTGGIIMAVKGAKKVPKQVPAQAFTIYEPSFSIGPGSVGLQGKF
jgi:hypothetical protein